MLKQILILIVILGVFFIAKYFLEGKEEKESKKKSLFKYQKKEFFMTRAEHEFYNILINIVGHEYYIFPQAHLSTIVDNKIVGQNWKAAFSHINGKSVDFVLCDKAYIAPRLAIELDDRSHEKEDRKERDTEVERILEEAGLPLLRFENHGLFNEIEIKEKILKSLIKE